MDDTTIYGLIPEWIVLSVYNAAYEYDYFQGLYSSAPTVVDATFE